MKGFHPLSCLLQGGALNPNGAWSDSYVEAWVGCVLYIDPPSLAEAVGASLPRQISDARALQLVVQLAVSKKMNLFLPMSAEPLLAGAALVAAANGTLRAEAVAFAAVAQQRNT